MKNPKLSIVAPAYNEEATIGEFYRRVSAAANEAVNGDEYEIVIVDDGSTDKTLVELIAISNIDSRVVTVQLSRNFGHQLALAAGLSVTKGDYVLIIDADLQDPPELMKELLQSAERQEADVVYGVRRSRDGETHFKKLTASIFYRLLAAMAESQIQRNAGDFRLISRRVTDLLVSMPEQFRFTRGLVGWLGFTQVPFYYDRDARYAGETKYSLNKMLRLAIDAATGFSVRPLRIASYLGLSAAAISFLGLAYTFASWVSGHTVSGWTSVLSAIFLVGGAQLLVLGVIGEYLGRLYLEAKARPQFVVKKIFNSKEKNERI